MLPQTGCESLLLRDQLIDSLIDTQFECCTLPVVGEQIIQALAGEISRLYRYEDGLHFAPGNIILIRHGTYEGGDPDLVVGVSDPSLNPNGVESARLAALELSKRCRERGISHLQVFTSPLARAKETAQIVSDVVSKEEIVCNCSEDPRLQAQNFGSFENKRFHELEISEESVHLYDNVRLELRPYVRTGSTHKDLGESSFQVALRVADFVQSSLRETNTSAPCLLVTHGSVVKTIKGLADDSPIELWDSLKLAHGSFATLVPRESVYSHYLPTS